MTKRKIQDPFLAAEELATPEGRGQALLKAHSRILNAGTFRVQDTVRALIDYDLWRSYRYRTESFEWGAREFDYFVQAWLSTDDPAYEWNVLRRNIVDPELVMAIADRSTGPVDGVERRSLDAVRDQLPGRRFDTVKLVSDYERRVAADATKRNAYLAGGAASTVAQPKQQRWRVAWSDGTAAEAIVAKILEDEVLAKDVYNKLRTHYDPRKRR